MALHTVGQLKDSIAGLLSGIDLSNVDDLNPSIERAASVLIQKADIPEASGIQNIVLYSGVFDYLCDPKIFGTAINDIRPQGITRNINDYTYKKYGDDFDRTKQWLPSGTMATFEYRNGVPIIRIVSKWPKQQNIIDNMTSTTGWVAGGTTSGLTQDNAVYYQAPASLRFTCTGLGTGTLTKTLQSSIDLSSYQGVGVAFLAIRIPDGATSTDLSSVSLKLGSNSSNYNTVIQSTGFLGAWTTGDWLLVPFDFANVSGTVGTPNWAAIQYVQVLVGTLATMVNFRVGDLFISQPSPAQILFQSAAIFIPANTTTAVTSITENTDTIVLNDPAYNLFLYEGAIAILENVGGGATDPTLAGFDRKLNGNGVNTFGLYGLYRGDNPSQQLRQITNWYDDNNGTNNGYNGY